MPADLVDSFLRYGYLVRVEPPWAGGPLGTTLLVPTGLRERARGRQTRSSSSMLIAFPRSTL